MEGKLIAQPSDQVVGAEIGIEALAGSPPFVRQACLVVSRCRMALGCANELVGFVESSGQKSLGQHSLSDGRLMFGLASDTKAVDGKDELLLQQVDIVR